MGQKLYSNINGVLISTNETIISSANELVRCRYGLYETMLLQDGIIKLAELHWQRLWNGLIQLGFIIPKEYSTTYFEAQILELAAQNGAENLSRIRIQFFAEGQQKPFVPFYFIEATSIDKSLTQWNEKGLVLGFLEDFKKPMCIESNSKINHSKHIPLAKKIIASQLLDDVLLINSAGRVIESSIANLFWIKGQVIFTVPLSEGCLAGTMRYWLLQRLYDKGYSVIEKRLEIGELMQADEVFLTNSIRQIKWVERIGERYFGNQKTKELYQNIFRQ